MKPSHVLAVALLLRITLPLPAATAPTPEVVKTALSRATDYLTSMSTEGGYLWWYSADLKERRGEEVATATQIWVQPPGTPSVGTAFLQAYAATGEKRHLQAAQAAAMALVRGQLQSGGWSYVIEFEPAARKQWAYQVDSAPQSVEPQARKNVTTFDDDNTQSALTFLMKFLATATNLPAAELRPIRTALNFGLDRMIDAQYPVGAWPQRFDGQPHDPAKHPVIPASIPTNWQHHWPHANYGVYYTLNDNAQSDCIQVMLAAHKYTGDPRYLAAARKGGEFLIRAQLPEPQAGWAQQYNFAMHPDWARAFEPPAVCANESGGAARTLMDLYLETGDEKFLEPIAPFLAWLQRSQISSNRWARLYELETNKPLYGDRDGEIHYTLEEISAERQRGYGWRGDFGLPGLIAQYERLRREGREKTLTRMQAREAGRSPSTNEVATILSEQDKEGRWLTRNGISMRVFITNMERLAAYLKTP